MVTSLIGYPQKLTKRISRERLDAVERAKRLLKYAGMLRNDRESVWLKNEKMYEGEQWTVSVDDPTADYITINMAFSTINTIVPFITGGDVGFIVKPYSGEASSVLARYQQVFLNRLWRSHEFSGAARLSQSSWDSLVYGDGFLGVGFDIRTQWRYDSTGQRIPTSDRDVVEFKLDRISPWDVWMDPNGDDLSSSRWYIVRTIIPLEQFKSDNRFFNTSDVEADTSSLYAQDGRLHSRQTTQELNNVDDYISVYHLYDVDERRTISFTDSSHLPHRWIEEQAPTLVQVANWPIPNMPWHMGEIEQIQSLQDELNMTRSQMITHRRRNAVKYIYRQDLLSDEAIDALQSSTPMMGVPITTDIPVNEAVAVLDTVNLSADSYNMTELTKADIYELTGVNEYLRGQVPDSARTATEASIIEGGSNVKISHKLRNVEEAARSVGQKILDIAAEALPATDFQELTLYLTGREAEEVLQQSGADAYSEQGQPLDAKLVPSPALFQGSYEVFVERGSTELRNPRFKEQKYKEMFMITLQAYPLMVQAGIFINLKRIYELWLEAAGVDDIDSILLNAPIDMAGAQALGSTPGESALEEILGGLQGGGLAGKTAQQPGVPNSFGVTPPGQEPSPSNSGMLAQTGL
jgi:hypothetical protein